MKIVGIYKIISPTGKVYIGQSRDIRIRHNQYKNLRCREQRKLFNSLSKYTFTSHQFIIVHQLPNDVEQIILDTYEQLYMDMYRDARIELLNLKEAGSKGKVSEETRQILRKANIGKTHSPEAREKLRQANIGRRGKGMYAKKHSAKSRKRMSEKAKGRIAWNKGKTTSIEIREKLSAAAKKRSSTDEYKKWVSNWRKGKAPWNKGLSTIEEMKRRAKCAA
jgi:group I intron endonuclease